MMRRLLICIFMIAGLARAYGQEDVQETGKVVAEGSGTVFPSLRGFRWDHILPNYGIGLRVEFKHNVNLRIDFGLGRQTAGFSFGFSEAF